MFMFIFDAFSLHYCVFVVNTVVTEKSDTHSLLFADNEMSFGTLT